MKENQRIIFIVKQFYTVKDTNETKYLLFSDYFTKLDGEPCVDRIVAVPSISRKIDPIKNSVIVKSDYQVSFDNQDHFFDTFFDDKVLTKHRTEFYQKNEDTGEVTSIGVGEFKEFNFGDKLVIKYNDLSDIFRVKNFNKFTIYEKELNERWDELSEGRDTYNKKLKDKNKRVLIGKNNQVDIDPLRPSSTQEYVPSGLFGKVWANPGDSNTFIVEVFLNGKEKNIVVNVLKNLYKGDKILFKCTNTNKGFKDPNFEMVVESCLTGNADISENLTSAFPFGYSPGIFFYASCNDSQVGIFATGTDYGEIYLKSEDGVYLNDTFFVTDECDSTFEQTNIVDCDYEIDNNFSQAGFNSSQTAFRNFHKIIKQDNGNNWIQLQDDWSWLEEDDRVYIAHNSNYNVVEEKLNFIANFKSNPIANSEVKKYTKTNIKKNPYYEIMNNSIENKIFQSYAEELVVDYFDRNTKKLYYKTPDDISQMARKTIKEKTGKFVLRFDKIQRIKIKDNVIENKRNFLDLKIKNQFDYFSREDRLVHDFGSGITLHRTNSHPMGISQSGNPEVLPNEYRNIDRLQITTTGVTVISWSFITRNLWIQYPPNTPVLELSRALKSQNCPYRIKCADQTAGNANMPNLNTTYTITHYGIHNDQPHILFNVSGTEEEDPIFDGMSEFRSLVNKYRKQSDKANGFKQRLDVFIYGKDRGDLYIENQQSNKRISLTNSHIRRFDKNSVRPLGYRYGFGTDYFRYLMNYESSTGSWDGNEAYTAFLGINEEVYEDPNLIIMGQFTTNNHGRYLYAREVEFLSINPYIKSNRNMGIAINNVYHNSGSAKVLTQEELTRIQAQAMANYINTYKDNYGILNNSILGPNFVSVTDTFADVMRKKFVAVAIKKGTEWIVRIKFCTFEGFDKQYNCAWNDTTLPVEFVNQERTNNISCFVSYIEENQLKLKLDRQAITYLLGEKINEKYGWYKSGLDFIDATGETLTYRRPSGGRNFAENFYQEIVFTPPSSNTESLIKDYPLHVSKMVGYSQFYYNVYYNSAGIAYYNGTFIDNAQFGVVSYTKTRTKERGQLTEKAGFELNRHDLLTVQTPAWGNFQYEQNLELLFSLYTTAGGILPFNYQYYFLTIRKPNYCEGMLNFSDTRYYGTAGWSGFLGVVNGDRLRDINNNLSMWGSDTFNRKIVHRWYTLGESDKIKVYYKDAGADVKIGLQKLLNTYGITEFNIDPNLSSRNFSGKLEKEEEIYKVLSKNAEINNYSFYLDNKGIIGAKKLDLLSESFDYKIDWFEHITTKPSTKSVEFSSILVKYNPDDDLQKYENQIILSELNDVYEKVGFNNQKVFDALSKLSEEEEINLAKKYTENMNFMEFEFSLKYTTIDVLDRIKIENDPDFGDYILIVTEIETIFSKNSIKIKGIRV